jgi:dinuclear metal center YbgI/SA1388 family protein
MKKRVSSQSVSLSKLEATLNQYLMCSQFEDYAPNGLQVEGKLSITKVALAVSATRESIEAAVEWGAETLVVHHGLFWKHQRARPLVGAWSQRVKLLIQNDMNLLAYHLPLDAHLEVGNAASLASLMRLKKIEPFGWYKKNFLGVKGQFQTPQNPEAVKKHLEKILQHPVLHAAPLQENKIHSIGIITGGAQHEWIQAHEAQLDAYITGEISEYDWHDAREAGLHFFAGGHHATERFGIQALGKKIVKFFPGLTIKFFDSENPA